MPTSHRSGFIPALMDMLKQAKHSKKHHLALALLNPFVEALTSISSFSTFSSKKEIEYLFHNLTIPNSITL